MSAQRSELLATAGTLDECAGVLEAGADAVNVGEQRFGLRLPGDFTLPMIGEAVRAAKERQAKIIVSVNNIMDNAVLQELPDYVAALEASGVYAIVFGDPAVLKAAKRHAPGLKLHWSAEMTSTNYATAAYWGRLGASRVILARELNMEQVLEFKQHVQMEVQVQVHGMTNIYHSKRLLIQSYADFSGRAMESHRAHDGSLYLTEAERPGQTYPIYEDENGTHVMSADDICMIENLPEFLEAGIDSLKIEGLLKPADYNAAVVSLYRQVIDAYYKDPASYAFDEAWLERIRGLQDPRRELSYGFYYKEQVY